jgi:hypothetical protein
VKILPASGGHTQKLGLNAVLQRNPNLIMMISSSSHVPEGEYHRSQQGKF